MAFGWDDAFLLSMQAAGAITSIYDANNKKKLIQMGRDLETAATETNLEAIRTQSAQESLEELKALRQNIGTQIVLNAAKGVSSGAGSALTNIEASKSNYLKDEKTRRLNLLMKENQLRAANVLSGLHTLTSETQLGQSLTNQIFNNLPVSSLVDKFKIGSKLEKGVEGIGTAIGKKFGFGLNPIGS